MKRIYSCGMLCWLLCLWTACDLTKEDFGEISIGGERYNTFEENPFVLVSEQAVSTFSIDADGGSYSNVRRFLNDNKLPPKEAVRVEELLNFFPFPYTQPTGDETIGIEGEVSACPWNDTTRLIRIGIQGKSIAHADLPPSNFVLLIDVSGSMDSDDKLDLLKEGLKLYFVPTLRSQDRVAIVTYAGKTEVLLPSTAGSETNKIKNAIDCLKSGGSTAGGAGIQKAYEIAEENFVAEGNNRIILATDGDFNVGVSSQEELVAMVEEKRESGIFLTTIGLGTGNYNEAMMEQIADKGNGTYEYIDRLEQVQKVFEYEFGKFYSVAKDVKVQVLFEPLMVKSYRLIGYENRLLDEHPFQNDSTDAGEIGSGQSITALYEIVLTNSPIADILPLYTIDFRYKKNNESMVRQLSLPIMDNGTTFGAATENQRFAASTAAFGMLLRQSPYKGKATYEQIIDWANGAQTFDPNAWRQELLSLMIKAKELE